MHLTTSTSNISESQNHSSISVSFSYEPARIEEMMQVKISSLGDEIVEEVWVEGINMYMGRIPVVAIKADNIWVGEFFLGSCSEPKMQWQLVVKLRSEAGDLTSIKQTFFSEMWAIKKPAMSLAYVGRFESSTFGSVDSFAVPPF